MSGLPLGNNWEQQLALFAASKKNTTEKQKASHSKVFTFKKSLSLGKSTSVNKVVPTVQPTENIKKSFTFKPPVNKQSITTASSKPVVTKKATISDFFQRSNSSVETVSRKSSDNLHASFFTDDTFVDDLSDFEIPSSCRSSNEHVHSQHPAPQKKATNVEESSIKKKVEKINVTNANLNTKSSNSTNINSNFGGGKKGSNENPDNIIEDFIDIEDFTPFLESDTEDEIIPVSRKSIRKISSEEENSTPESVAKVQSERPGKLVNSKTKVNNNIKSDDSFNVLHDFEHSSLLDDNLENISSADSSHIQESLQEMNYKVMTQMCDFLQANETTFKHHGNLARGINIRKKILHQLDTIRKKFKTPQATEKSITPKPFNFQKLKPGLLFQSKSFNCDKSPMVQSAQSPHFQNTSTSSDKSPHMQSPHFQNTSTSSDRSPPSPSLISNMPSTSTKDTTHDFFSFKRQEPLRTSFQNKETPGANKDSSLRPLSLHSNCMSSTINIEDVETQNLLEQSIYDICDDDDDFSEAFDDNNVDNSREDVISGKFEGNQKDDGASPEFKGCNFPFSQDLHSVFQNVFGLKNFRHNQLEAINAALLKEDCFILMPTGGGKSLCYQLPALVNCGVTIVVSPLRSLIMDQVQKLTSLDIPAGSLTGDTDTSTVNTIYYQLSAREPSIKLLYVTPEKISASVKLMSAFENLYSRSMIQRFVIDEAHCVSQWGHDFRPDYKRLKILREKFPNVPMMALTATATQRVRTDILHQLGMKSPKWFLQSFNRPNLKYEVRLKSKQVVPEIIELIKGKFKNMCGIVYCLSRNDCDAVSQELFKSGITSAPYHAGLDNREEIQEGWINDKFKVICATIAFGMGIDKPDVRFVIHHAIPKSLEGYYQESGRAGRDGERSYCYLYYCYKDMHRLKRMVMKDDTNKHSWGTHFDNIFRMVMYCENKTDCRRVWMLTYFGEIFDRQLCLNDPATTCDNCSSKEAFEVCDVTENAKAIIQCVSKIVNRTIGKNFTLPYLVDIYKGAKTQKILAAGHDKLELHGKGAHLKRTDADRLLRKLVLDQFLHEETSINTINKMEIPINYVYLGKRAKELMFGNVKVTMPFQKGTKNKRSLPVIAQVEDKEILQLIEKCYNELIEVSKAIAQERHLHYTNVMNVEALRVMSRQMPMTEEDMLTIPHVTRAVYEKYGRRFLDVTARYAAERCVIDAEKADQNILATVVDEADNWSDAEPPSPTSTRQGQKRKRFAKGGPSKKQKSEFWKKKWGKGKTTKKYTGSTQTNKFSKGKKTATNSKLPVTQVTLKAPGFLPMPTTKAKAASRSFLPPPKLVMM